MRRIHAYVAVLLLGGAAAHGQQYYDIEGLDPRAGKRRTDLRATHGAAGEAATTLRGVRIPTVNNILVQPPLEKSVSGADVTLNIDMELLEAMTTITLEVDADDPFEWLQPTTGTHVLKAKGGTWDLNTPLIFKGDANVISSEQDLDLGTGSEAPTPENRVRVRLPYNKTDVYDNGVQIGWSKHAAEAFVEFINPDINPSTGAPTDKRRAIIDFFGQYVFGPDDPSPSSYGSNAVLSGYLSAGQGITAGGGGQFGQSIFIGGGSFGWPTPQLQSLHADVSVLAKNDVHAVDGIYAGDPNGNIGGLGNPWRTVTNGHLRSYGNAQINSRADSRSNLEGLLIGGDNLTDSQFRFYSDSTGLHIKSEDDGIAYTGTEQINMDAPTMELGKRLLVPSRVTAGAGISVTTSDTSGTLVITNTGGGGGVSDTLDDVADRGATTDQVLTVGGITTAGNVSAGNLSGNGLSVTNLDAGNLVNTVADARLSVAAQDAVAKRHAPNTDIETNAQYFLSDKEGSSNSSGFATRGATDHYLSWVESLSRWVFHDDSSIPETLEAAAFIGDGSQLTNLDPAALSTAVSAAKGGTGLTAPGTSGNVLTSDGTGWVSSAPSAGGVGSTPYSDSANMEWGKAEYQARFGQSLPDYFGTSAPVLNSNGVWGTATTIAANGGNATAYGANVRYVTGTTINNIAGYARTAPTDSFPARAALVFEAVANIALAAAEAGTTLASLRAWVGFGSDSTALATTADPNTAINIAFRYDSSTDTNGNWHAYTSSGGGTSTITDTGVSATNALVHAHQFRIVIQSPHHSGLAAAKFYLNGTLVATHTTNLPDTGSNVALMPTCRVITKEAASKAIRCYRMRVNWRFNVTSGF